MPMHYGRPEFETQLEDLSWSHLPLFLPLCFMSILHYPILIKAKLKKYILKKEHVYKMLLI